MISGRKSTHHDVQWPNISHIYLLVHNNNNNNNNDFISIALFHAKHAQLR